MSYKLEDELIARKLLSSLDLREGDISALDAEGKSLLWRAGDLRARFVLLDAAEALLAEPDLTLEMRRACCQLAHAMGYLQDRLAYELYPWPKNKFKLELRV